ncbi:conserved Plasmodium protein, unknown function [Plasmodium berghei]|uniref:Dynein axonemal assembly factor 5 TPR repeats domain-containing protein n=2 Tax=Plasmodium berghei TaxID=5821 RepID=A0A509AKG5_PLABA|nr:conserved Plasmodium protein, unknown function [Plasmodium berghei ANKA]CXI45274.1 conserved Plasmodium protein, unknown function [Plasmodium berghei]SCN25567.1 conserved Plasmodium protein, unknown function [Plasmodium berghei]SCO60519.1 conserved Plasmodium protein, unknown function [Plasmodium berghei]VUC55890.1 conserved Plasmodium protein, unknown function [Plasmodium berghei ANKA]|eukprot:XP_034421700.1 conserved Plasmodium protein, unknown function [Plasmodium berghei ANKA]
MYIYFVHILCTLIFPLLFSDTKMSNTIHEENIFHVLFPKCMENHLELLNNRENSDNDEKLNSLNFIHEKLIDFFNKCNDDVKKRFCAFFHHYLFRSLNIWINDEFDECRIFALNIYFLIENNLNDILLNEILFKNIENDKNSFLLICVNRLKEDENKKIVEEKEEIRLKILQFLKLIINRYKNYQTNKDMLNIYIYIQDILIALSLLINDPFPLIKKTSFEILSELNFEEPQKGLAPLYRNILKKSLANLSVRNHEIQELAIKCIKRFMSFECNRDILNEATKCLKKVFVKKYVNVLFEVVDCIEVWNLKIKNLNNIEIAKLIFIILLCMHSNISLSLNKRCYEVLVSISKSKELVILEGNEKEDIDNHLKNLKNEKDEEYEYINSTNNDYDNKKIKKKYLYYEDTNVDIYEYYFQSINKFSHILFTSSILNTTLNNFFINIKKELFYEIMNNVKNSWTDKEDLFANIINTFLLYTYYDISYFIKNIILFIYKSLIHFKCIDYPTTPLLINDILMLLAQDKKPNLEKYYYEFDSFLYIAKFIYLIITCGYLMPVHDLVFEMAKILLGENNKNAVLKFFQKFNEESMSETKYLESPHSNQIFMKNKFIFQNENFHKYLQKVYHMNFEKKKEIIIEERNDEESSGYFKRDFQFDQAHQFFEEKKEINSENEIDRYNTNTPIQGYINHSSAVGKTGNELNEEKRGNENNKYEEEIKIDTSDIWLNGYCETEVTMIYENKKIILMMISQFLCGHYIKSYTTSSKLNDECINLILFLINENINYENSDTFPYILITLKLLLDIIKIECTKYSKVIFHFLIILQSNDQNISHKEINKIIEKIEYYNETNRTHFYNEEYIFFIQNIKNIIDFNNFNNFKYVIDFLNTLICNITENVVIEYSYHLIDFFTLIINHELLLPLMKSEFLLFLNLFCSKDIFPNFFSNNSEYLIKNILLPLCKWKSGLNEACIRKGALYCIRALLNKNKKLHQIDIFKNCILIDSLIRVLKSNIDDTWNNENREICISIFSQFSENINNNNILLDLLNSLIKLLDDSNKIIRKSSALAIYTLIQNKFLILPDDVCKNIFPILLLHMDDDSSSISEIIYNILSIGKKINSQAFLRELEHTQESTPHAKKFKQQLMK